MMLLIALLLLGNATAFLQPFPSRASFMHSLALHASTGQHELDHVVSTQWLAEHLEDSNLAIVVRDLHAQALARWLSSCMLAKLSWFYIQVVAQCSYDMRCLIALYLLHSRWQEIRGKVKKEQAPGADFVATVYEGLHSDYLDAHIPGAVFVDWTKVSISSYVLLQIIYLHSHVVKIK
jgi:hypothetical protein